MHNHPPRCCCPPPVAAHPLPPVGPCPACPEHGELAASADRCTCGTPGLTYAGPERDCPEHGEVTEPRPGECPRCHQPIGRPHTDYCPFDGIVSILRGEAGPEIRDDQAGTHITIGRPQQWLHYAGDPSRIDHRVLGGQWHNSRTCRPEVCGSTPDEAHATADRTLTPTAPTRHLPIHQTDRWTEHPITQCAPEHCGEYAPNDEPTPTTTPIPPDCPTCHHPIDVSPGYGCTTPAAHDHPR